MIYKHKATNKTAKLIGDKYFIEGCTIGVPKELIERDKCWQKEDEYVILEHVDEKGNRWRKSGDWESCVAVGCGDGKKHILSVKRLSDNEIFSIGDKVSERLSDKKEFNIESFNVYHDRLVIGIKKRSTHATTGFRFLDKVKDPVIITEDDIELFEGDEYYTIYVMDDNRYNTWITQEIPFIINASKSAYIHEGVRYFAKKESAEKYIKDNKKKYSLNDISEAIKHYKHFEQNCQRNEFNILKYLQND